MRCAGSAGRRCAPACSTSTACSPTPPACTRRPGRRCSTTSCGNAPSARRAVRAVRRRRRLPDVRRRQDGARTACARSSPAAASSCPRATPTTARTPRRSTAWATARTTLFQQDAARATASTVFEGSRRYLEAVADAGLAVAVVSSSANTREVLEVTGLAQFVEQRVDGVTHARGGHRRQARTGLLPAGRASCSASSPAQAAVFEDALAGVQAGRAGRLRLRRRRRPGRPGRGVAAQRRRRRRRPTSPSCCEHR